MKKIISTGLLLSLLALNTNAFATSISAPQTTTNDQGTIDMTEMTKKMTDAQKIGIEAIKKNDNIKMMKVDGKEWKYVMSDGMMVLENKAVIMKHGDMMYKMHGDDMFMMDTNGMMMKNDKEMMENDQDMMKMKNCMMEAKKILEKK